MQRSDAPLIKHITNLYGVETGRAWQRSPLVVLPGEGFLGRLFDDEDRLLCGLDVPPYIPWRDVVLDFRDDESVLWTRFLEVDGEDRPPRGGLWVRVRDATGWARENAHGRTWGHRIVENQTEFLSSEVICEAWLSWFMRFPVHPITHSWDRAAGTTSAIMCQNPVCGPCNADDDRYARTSEVISRVAALAFSYLAQCNEHLVEVAPKERKPLPLNRLKAQDAKPWLKETLPHYILLDPERVHEYGHPSAQRGPVGSHASPRPHTRRGHWAVLQSDRFERNADGTPRRVWRKQAWVGATEWTDGLNQRYRLVTPAVEEPVRRLALVT